jgi:hypothetical protein
MLKRLALSVAIAMAVPAVAYAQGDVREQGDRACGADAKRLCRNVLGQGDFAVLACLQQNATRLKPICRQFLQSQGQL